MTRTKSVKIKVWTIYTEDGGYTTDDISCVKSEIDNLEPEDELRITARTMTQYQYDRLPEM